MSTVTYKNQPAIHKTRGAVPLSGTSHPYTVSKVLWPGEVENWIADRLVGRTLHVCCGMSQLGDIRLDLFQGNVNVRADAARLPFPDVSFDTVLADFPYNGKFQWQHDAMDELGRVSRKRIVYQNWYLPVNRRGQYKKYNSFRLTECAVWQGQAYFGRAQVITVMDKE